MENHQEIVNFPMKHGDFPWLCESLPEGSSNEISQVPVVFSMHL